MTYVITMIIWILYGTIMLCGTKDNKIGHAALLISLIPMAVLLTLILEKIIRF